MENILNDYVGEFRGHQEPKEEKGIKTAVPKIFDYRERFKKRELRNSDVSTIPHTPRILDSNGDMDQIDRIAGGVFFGPGTEIDF